MEPSAVLEGCKRAGDRGVETFGRGETAEGARGGRALGLGLGIGLGVGT